MMIRVLRQIARCWPLYVGLVALAVLAACDALSAWRQPPPGWNQPAPQPTPAPQPVQPQATYPPNPYSTIPHGSGQYPSTPVPGPGTTPGPGTPEVVQHPWTIIEPTVGALAPFLPPPWDVIVIGATGIIGGVLYGRRRRQDSGGAK